MTGRVEFRGYGIGRGGVQWDSRIYMRAMRNRPDELGRKPPERIFTLGFSRLVGGRSTATNPSSAWLEFKPRREASYFVDSMRNQHFTVSSIGGKFTVRLHGSPEISVDLVPGRPFVLGARSPDTPWVRDYFGENFPPFACAVTLEASELGLGKDTILFESLSPVGTIVYFNAQEPFFYQHEIQGVVWRNIRLLRQMIKSGEIGRIGKAIDFLFPAGEVSEIFNGFEVSSKEFAVFMSLKGEIVSVNEKPGIEHYPFVLRYYPGNVIEYSDFNELIEEHTSPPEIFKKIMLRTVWGLNPKPSSNWN